MKKKWFKIEEAGELKRFGYSADKSSESRHRALDEAVKSPRNSGLEVFHKLLGLANVTKKKQPSNSIIYRADSNYVKKKYINTELW